VGDDVGDDVGNDDVTWVSMADNGGVDGSGQQHGRRRWLGQRRTTVWSMVKGDNPPPVIVANKMTTTYHLLLRVSSPLSWCPLLRAC
jgi:hypothetical protein